MVKESSKTANDAFGPLKQIDAGVLNVGYVNTGPPDAPVQIVVHNYRWRIGRAEGETSYDGIEVQLAKFPDIAVPAISLEGDANGAPHPDAESYAKKFAGRYEHRVISGGVGHNLPQEAPRAFADAVIDVDAF